MSSSCQSRLRRARKDRGRARLVLGPLLRTSLEVPAPAGEVRSPAGPVFSLSPGVVLSTAVVPQDLHVEVAGLVPAVPPPLRGDLLGVAHRPPAAHDVG